MIGAFTKNTLITFVTRIITVIFGIGISIIIARILSLEGKGIYSLAMLPLLFLISFMNFGIGEASVFYISKRKYSAKEVFGIDILFTALISTLAILIEITIIFFFSDNFFSGVAKTYLLLALFFIPFQFFLHFVNSILLGLQIGFPVILNIILNILWIPKFGILGAAWATAVSYSIAFIITVFIYDKISGNKFKDVIFFKKSDFLFYKNLLLSIKDLKSIK